MSKNSFFNEQTEQSFVKATIVSKYFDVWSNVIISTQKRYPDRFSGKIAYIDLFAGPGRYADGTQSTPVKILKNAIEKPDIRDRLVTLFNDKDEENYRSLEKTINDIPGVETLRYKPRVENEEEFPYWHIYQAAYWHHRSRRLVNTGSMWWGDVIHQSLCMSRRVLINLLSAMSKWGLRAFLSLS